LPRRHIIEAAMMKALNLTAVALSSSQAPGRSHKWPVYLLDLAKRKLLACIGFNHVIV
jgi:hypothetical protein